MKISAFFESQIALIFAIIKIYKSKIYREYDIFCILKQTFLKEGNLLQYSPTLSYYFKTLPSFILQFDKQKTTKLTEPNAFYKGLMIQVDDIHFTSKLFLSK